VNARLLTALTCFVAVAAAQDEPRLPQFEAIVGVRVVPMDTSAEFLEDVTVLLADGVVVEIGKAPAVALPEGTTVIDGLGRTLLPGLVDVHVHLDGGGAPRLDRDPERAARAALRSGVTMVLDLNGAENVILALRERERLDPELVLPRIFAAGSALTIAGGHGTEGGYPARLLATGGDPTELVTELAGRQVDWVKVMVDGGGRYGEPQRPTLSDGDVARIIEVAHRLGLRVAVHAIEVSRARAAVEAGADMLSHVPVVGEVDDSFVSLLAERGTIVTPTLAAYEAQATAADDRGFDPRERVRADYFSEHLPAISAAVSRMIAAGVRIVPGSDAGMPGVFHGQALHQELIALERAGMPRSEILDRATRVAAEEVLSITGRSRIVRDSAPDLVLVDGNPLLRLGDLARVVAVWKGGRRVPEALLSEPAAAAEVELPFRERRRVADFESPDLELARIGLDVTRGGISPKARADDPHCAAEIVEERIDDRSERFLRIHGRRSDDSHVAGSEGIAIALGAPQATGGLAGFRAVRFRFRGGAIEHCRIVLVPANARDSDHHGRTIACPEVFTTVELPFADFSQVGYGDRRPLDLEAITMIAFCPAPDTAGEFRLEIDDVELVR
jgi:imidazolonepropionase-like amidohydrolase